MNSELKKTVIIGSGNLAEALARAVAKSELELVQIFARNAERARIVAELAATGWETRPEMLRKDADIYLIAVSDRAVAEVAATLPIPEEAAVAHTAGSVPVTAIPERFARRAVFYPMQTFTRGREADFSVIPVFLEASSPELRPELEAFARKLSGTVIWGRLGTALQGASRGGFRLQLRQSHVCRGRTYRPRCGAGFRRAETADRRNRGQGLRRPFAARRADGTRRAQRFRHEGPPRRPAGLRPPTEKHLLNDKSKHMGNFKEDIARCEAFVFDVDGVMTDGGIIPTPDGDFIRRYNAKDGYALAYAIKIGYKVCIITGGLGAGRSKTASGCSVSTISTSTAWTRSRPSANTWRARGSIRPT